LIPNLTPKVDPKNIKALIDLQKSKTKKIKEEKRYIFQSYRGKCECCHREEVLIVMGRIELCAMCLNWIKNWANKIHGYYNRKFIASGIIEFRKPIKCRFFDICGSIMNRINEDGTINRKRIWICDRCIPIYDYGLRKGLYEKTRKRSAGRNRHA